jgi:hypothetical protein
MQPARGSFGGMVAEPGFIGFCISYLSYLIHPSSFPFGFGKDNDENIERSECSTSTNEPRSSQRRRKRILQYSLVT